MLTTSWSDRNSKTPSLAMTRNGFAAVICQISTSGSANTPISSATATHKHFRWRTYLATTAPLTAPETDSMLHDFRCSITKVEEKGEHFSQILREKRGEKRRESGGLKREEKRENRRKPEKWVFSGEKTDRPSPFIPQD